MKNLSNLDPHTHTHTQQSNENDAVCFLDSSIRKAHYDELINIWKFDDKLKYAELKIKEFLNHCKEYYQNLKTPKQSWEVFISFSGGKDSTVLLDLVLKVHKKIKSKIYLVPAYAYEITFPETINFIKKTVNQYQKIYPYLKELYLAKPKLAWYEILKKHGYPIFSKQVSVHLNRIKKVKSKNGLTNWVFGINTARYKIPKNRIFLLDDKLNSFPTTNIDLDYFGQTLFEINYKYSEKCCDYIKGGLKHLKVPSFVGVMAEESDLRKQSWIKHGCNVINDKHLVSRPLSLFKTQDVWEYIKKNDLEINPMYGYNKNNPKNLKYQRLGCISCPYGSHLEEERKKKDKNAMNRFEVLYQESLPLYKAQVIDNGMYKILINMGIKIEQDKKYMQLYQLRWKQINEYYENFNENFLNVITQIENYNNYKNIDLNKWKKANWHYTDNEIIQICQNYGIDWTKEKILKIINRYRKEKMEKNYGK